MEEIASWISAVCLWQRSYSAGPDVQDIFDGLPDTGGPKDYEKAEKALYDYFMTHVNVPYPRHQFAEVRQGKDEPSPNTWYG